MLFSIQNKNYIQTKEQSLYIQKRDPYEKDYKNILRKVQASFTRLCQGKILKSFIKQARKSEFIISNNARVEDATALAAIKPLSKINCYVDLICAKKGEGKKLMHKIETWARKQDYKIISLRAANRDLISVYERWGFQRVDTSCEKKANYTFKKDDKSGYYMTKCLTGEGPAPLFFQVLADKAAELTNKYLKIK